MLRFWTGPDGRRYGFTPSGEFALGMMTGLVLRERSRAVALKMQAELGADTAVVERVEHDQLRAFLSQAPRTTAQPEVVNGVA